MYEQEHAYLDAEHAYLDGGVDAALGVRLAPLAHLLPTGCAVRPPLTALAAAPLRAVAPLAVPPQQALLLSAAQPDWGPGGAPARQRRLAAHCWRRLPPAGSCAQHYTTAPVGHHCTSDAA